MDDTRFFSENFFLNLNPNPFDIGVINEREAVKNMYDKMINRQIDINYNSKIDPNSNMFLLPRMYRTCILKEALNNIKNNLSSELFKNIKAMDLELIYYESYKISNNIEILNDNYIIHTTQDLIREIKKYYKYGKNTKVLKNTVYSNLGKPNSRIRKPRSIIDFLVILCIYTIRGVPFLLGYLLN